jgi:hypothetical protein
MTNAPDSMIKIAALLVCLVPYALFAVSPGFQKDCEELTKHAHRLCGTEEYRDAADYVEKRLATIGMDEIIVQEFTTAQTFIKRCEARAVDGTVLPLLPMRPNNIIPPVTPPDGITGDVIYVGKGTYADLEGRDVDGKIAIVDYNCEANWLRVFRLGAKAIIFVRNNEELKAGNYHYNCANANLPRYFYNGSVEDLVRSKTLTIHCEQVWKRVVGRNVMGFLEGTNPVFFLEKPEVIILSVGMDSFGEVPRISPGARGAANCAGLLSLVEYFKTNRPARDLLFIFFDGECRGYNGAKQFYMALEDTVNNQRIEDRRESWVNETNFLSQTVSLINRENPFEVKSGAVRREFENRLHELAKGHSEELKQQLNQLREKQYAIALLPDEQQAAESNRVIQIDKAIDRCVELKSQWNELRRDFDREAIDPGRRVYFTNVLSRLRTDIGKRIQELEEEDRFLASGFAVKKLLITRQIIFHASLLLDDTTKRWSILLGGETDMHAVEDKTGLYSKILRACKAAYQLLNDSTNPLENFEPASVDGTLDEPRLLWAAPLLVRGCEVAGRYGYYNITFGTCHGTIEHEGTPDDTLEYLDLDIIEENTREIGHMLEVIGSSDDLSLRDVISKRFAQVIPSMNKAGRTTGPVVMGRRPGTSLPSKPMADMVFQLFHRPPFERFYLNYNKAYGFDQFIVMMTDQNGAYGPCSWYSSWPKVGMAFAAGFDERGIVNNVTDKDSLGKFAERMNMFNCKPIMVMIPPLFLQKDIVFLNARGNSKLPASESFSGTKDGVAYCYFEQKINRLKAFDTASLVALNNNPKLVEGLEQPEYGIGLPVGEGNWLGLKTAEQSGWDLWRLNEQRLSIMRERNIINSSLEELHSRVKDLLDTAEETEHPLKREALAASAFMTAAPVYKTILSTLDDLVKAALILLALCIPFAFALERLLIGSTIIYKQAAWFVGFFILTFVILYLSHPAFAIARTPIIVFLGFSVVTLSALVIVIMMQRFETELKALQGMKTSVHTVDVSRFSTVMAAMTMGMSTMRRRPLRTTLTAVTIILLTFTILCFASFDTQTGIVRMLVAPTPSYTGVLVHKTDWRAYNAEFFDVIEGRWADETTVCPRYWICPSRQGFPDFAIAREDGTHPFRMKGVLGIAPEELLYRKDLCGLLGVSGPAEFSNRVFFTEAVAKEIGVSPGDTVVVKGLSLTVGPLLSSTRLGTQDDMDGNTILPVDFVEMKKEERITMLEQEEKEPSGDLLEEQKIWTRLASDSVVILSASDACRIGAQLHAALIYTDDVTGAGSVADDIARMLNKTPVIATLKDGTYRLVHTTVVAASGVADLLFPLILGGLVVFGTMLSSVADREKEIYTFSALGLAPPHVASLFFAEALVYSVLGGLGGYLIAQMTMKLLEIGADYGWVTVPEMNYSSINAIVTILIVMATVLVSSIYPAIKASRSANPGLMRSWKIPEPDGDLLRMVFPFTVSEYDLTGVVSFLKEHFDNFSDTGIGCFMAKNAEVIARGDGSVGVTALIALAPFDLGVTQDFDLESTPSEIKGIDEIVLNLIRRSGQPKDWIRLNKVMLNDLRKQFLLWRSLPHETMEVYRARTLSTMGTMNT